MRILVTAGATREPIDAVRFLSNTSTGATGAALTDALARRGHEVVHLHGPAAALPVHAASCEGFSSAADLQQKLARRLAPGGFDAVIMAAAVADYRPAAASSGKISSDSAALTLPLTRNEKILPQLKGFSPTPLRVIGFKLTAGSGEQERRQAVARQFAAGGVDAVVHNDLTEIRAAAVHPFWLWRSAITPPRELSGTTALVDALTEILGAPAR